MGVELIITAVTFGLFTSLHCIGMCGPIALAIPLNNESKSLKVLGALVYNIGRAVTYAVMGAIFGLVGKGFEMAGFQKWVSITIGAIMVLMVLFPGFYKNRFDLNKKTFAFFGNLRLKMGQLLKKQGLMSLFTFGLLNGLLPCGMVYAALAGSIVAGNSLHGALFMFIFGLGTMPTLFIMSIMSNSISIKWRKKLNKLIPAAIMFFGLLFILRGLGLGIPFVSPPDKKLNLPEKTKMEEHGCCSKH